MFPTIVEELVIYAEPAVDELTAVLNAPVVNEGKEITFWDILVEQDPRPSLIVAWTVALENGFYKVNVALSICVFEFDGKVNCSVSPPDAVAALDPYSNDCVTEWPLDIYWANSNTV